jgi:O-antigen/teichoic acid export membrane protein
MVGSSIQLDGDKTVLNAYGMADVAGVYGAAFRVVNMAFTPIKALNSAAHNRLLQNDPNARGEHVRRSARLAMLNLAAVLPIAAVLFFAVELLEPLLGDDFEQSAGIARWLLLFLPLKAVSNAPLGGLLGLGRTTTRAWVVLTAAGVSLGLYVALIPLWSWGGAVVGTVIGELVLLLVGTNRLRKWQRIHDESVSETRPETIATQ